MAGRRWAGLGCAGLSCAVLAACTAAGPKGPVATATPPRVGRPPAPASAQAALSGEAFTPYAGLGAAVNDGLAPGDTFAALHTACMNEAGYGQYAASAPFAIRANRGLAFAQPAGPWGYLGAALASQQGFAAGAGDDFQATGQPGGPPSAALPAAAQTAAAKCLNIVLDFNDAQFTRALAGIETLNNVISTDVITDPAFKRAVRAWTACMSRNGYHAPGAIAFAQQQQDALGLRGAAGPGTTPPAGQQRAQIAAAVADAGCTASTDLGGIYFAVQAGYEQQLVDANQPELAREVRQYKAAYARELRRLPALLRTASARPLLTGRPAPSARPSGRG